MKKDLFIGSLHRPFNTRLKTCKWVCSFAKTYRGTNFKNDFFVHIINYLQEFYQKNNSVYGLPKKETIEVLYQYVVNHQNIQEDLARFGDPQKKNDTEIDKKLFSRSIKDRRAKSSEKPIVDRIEAEFKKKVDE